MARVLLICVILSIVYFAATVKAADVIKPPTAISNRRRFIEKLNQLVSYVDQGFLSVGSSFKALKEDLEKDRQLISSLNLRSLNSSVNALKSLEPECLDGWTKHAGRCFKFTNCAKGCMPRTTIASCRKEQSVLASCLSLADQEFFIRSLGQTKQIFLGGNDIANEGTWVWADGSLMKAGYTNWQSNEPNSGTHYDCMVLVVSTKKWQDMNCAAFHTVSSKAGFVCEKELAYQSLEPLT